MPELPEVETTVAGITPYVLDQQIQQGVIRFPTLRWPICEEIETVLPGLSFSRIWRRAKYILLESEKGILIIHLGMSGSLRVVQHDTPIEKHDHVDLVFKQHILRYTDPRRFGAFLFTQQPVEEHSLLAHLGPEPLSDDFTAAYLTEVLKTKSTPIKNAIMDNKIVVGVGNIYASESLFLAKIRPQQAANKISAKRLTRLVEAIKTVLEQAIQQGGTTLNDFVQADGKPGYFKQSLNVYGRKNEPCTQCRHEIKQIVMGQRATYYCAKCQR